MSIASLTPMWYLAAWGFFVYWRAMDVNEQLRQVRAALASKDFLRFVTFINERYKTWWHHKAIADKLERFARGEIKKLMLFVPPQHGKSELSSRNLPAYLLGLYPDRNTGIFSYSDDLAGGFSDDCQRIMDSEEYQMVFPDTRIPKKGGHSDYKRNGDECQIIGRKGKLYSAGTGNPLTGKTIHFAIIDDPVKDRADANSATLRQKTWDWYVDVLSSRLNNDSQVLILMTRWHEEDLAGKLLKLDEENFKNTGEREWTVIRYPAIKEAEDGEYAADDDPRETGEALWPEMHAAENHWKQKQKSEQTFNSLYQQRPSTPEGNIFKTAEIGVITMAEFTERMRGKKPVYDFKIDGAYTDKTQNDASALYSSTFMDNIIYVRKCQEFRLEFDPLLERIESFCKANGYSRKSTIKVEPKANGLSIIQSMKRRTLLNIKPYKWGKDDDGNRMDKQDKVERANAVAPFVNSGRVVLVEDGSGWTVNFLQQVAAFPNSAHDDMVDDMVMDVAEKFLARQGSVVISRS